MAFQCNRCGDWLAAPHTPHTCQCEYCGERLTHLHHGAHCISALRAELAQLRAQQAALVAALTLLLSAADGPPWVLPSGEYLGAKRMAEDALAAAQGEQP